MAYRLGQNTWWNFYPETSYGVISTTQSTIPYVHSQTLNMQSVHSPIERPYKSGQITPAKCGTVYGYKEGEVTIEAAYNQPLFHILMKSWLQNNYSTASTAGTYHTISTSPVSYTIAEYDKDNPTYWRLAKGCVVKSLQLSHTKKDVVKLSATLAAKQITDWAARTTMTGSGAHYSTIGCNEAVLTAEVGYSSKHDGNGAALNYTSFNLSLDTQFMDDMFKYGTSLTPTYMNAALKTGVLTVQYPYDPTAAGSVQGAIGDTTAGVSETYIKIGDTVATTYNIYTFLQGIYSSYTAADPDNGTWLNSEQITLAKVAAGTHMLYLERTTS